MKIVNANYEILTDAFKNPNSILQFLEKCGRICYKSENVITDGSADRFLANIIKSGHESVLEHQSLSVKFIISRATSHQLVRHRIASFSQQSQRYCNYAHDKFNNEIEFIKPLKFIREDESNPSEAYRLWKDAMSYAEKAYFDLMSIKGVKPQEAREVLPNSTKTELMMTANIREWRHIFKLRIAKGADDGIRYIMLKLLDELKNTIPVLFDDIEEN